MAPAEPPGPILATDTEAELGQRKLIRLSLACNQFRRRKVRCDAQLPKCRNCSLRNEDCETSDLKRPGAGPVVRRRATKSTHRRGGLLDRSTTGSGTPTSPLSVQRYAEAGGGTAGLSRSRGYSMAGTIDGAPLQNTARDSPVNTTVHRVSSYTPSVGTTDRLTGDDETITWVSRGYQESTAAQSHSVIQAEKSLVVATPDVIVNTDDTTYKFKVQIELSSQLSYQKRIF